MLHIIIDAESTNAYVETTTYHLANGIAAVEFESPPQATLVTDEEIILLIGGESDQGAMWSNRLKECPYVSLNVDSYYLWVGGTLTVNGVEQEQGACSVSIYNYDVTETLDFGVGNFSSCVAMFNISTVGVYSVDMTCNMTTATPTWSTSYGSSTYSPFTNPTTTVSAASVSHSTTSFPAYRTYQCPEKRESCLGGASLLDDSFKDPSDPMVSYASSRLTLWPTNITALDVCGGSRYQTYNWRMFLISAGETKSVTIDKPNLQYLNVPQNLVSGFYVVILEVEWNITMYDRNLYEEDFIYLRILLPELVSTLNGAVMRESNGNETIVFDASESKDPVTRSGILTDRLFNKWYVLYVPGLSYIETINCIASFPSCSLLESTSVQWNTITDPDMSKYLSLNTSIFPNNSTVFVIFTMLRGSRVASSIQSIYISDSVRPVNLSCLYNCRSSANDKMSYDKLEMLVAEEGLGARYTWTAMKLENNTFAEDTNLTNKLAAYGSVMSVSKSDVTPGMTYLFSVLMTVTVDGQLYQTRAGYMKTVNYVPYGGSCTISKTRGQATLEFFMVTCSGWLDEGERISRDPKLDTGAQLTYSIVQSTRDAYIADESILVSIYKRMVFYLKTGDLLDDDRTNVTVHIIDVFGDAAKVTFTVQSVPQLDVTTITADEIGAQNVLDFMALAKDTIDERKSFNYDRIMTIVTSAADQLLQIPLPVKPAQIAKTVDGEDGVLLDIDLSDTNSSHSITFEQYYETSISSEVDPATYQIQLGFEYLALKAYEILLSTVVYGNQADNQLYLNQLTQCFNNFIGETKYATAATKGYVVEGLRILSNASGTIWIDSTGLTAEEEQAETALVDMTAGTINSVVPNDLQQARRVDNIDEARRQIDDMVDIFGRNMTAAVSDAVISPSERAYLYMKVQNKLKYELENVKDLARSSAASVFNVSRSILSTTDLCLSCSRTVGTGLNRQKLVSMTSSDLGSTTMHLNTAAIRLDSLVNGGQTVQKVLMMQMEKNIYMYDSDGTSSQIVHGVTRLELADNTQVLDNMTYEQIVDHVESKVIEPIIYIDDVSGFSYHKFVYRNAKDNVCLRLIPCVFVIEEYVVYLRFLESPTILDYDARVTVSAATNWITCIRASLMKGHTGMNYLGVEAKFVSIASEEDKTPYPCYEFALVTVACLNWEEESESWRNDKCELEWMPDTDKVICMCHQIKDLTFGTSFFLAPNTIDFSTAFLKFSPLNQAAVISATLILFVIYVVVVVWARRQDRQDILMWGIKPLVDNYPTDSYFFVMKVYTGFRLGSGTDSQIAFRLSGDRHDSGVRVLSDGIRKRFGKGSVMQFMMSSDVSLGVLTHLRIWHDNQGKGEMASWYLSKIVVTDLQDSFSYTFQCEDWIAVEHADASMDKLLFVANKEYLESFNHRFTVRTKDRLINGHLLMSVFYRPTYSNFTRVQRATCAYMAFMITMLANAMYFNPEDNYETQTSLEIGPLRFSLHQVLVALICAAISTLPTLFVMTIFSKTKRRIPVMNGTTPSLDESRTDNNEKPIHDNDGETSNGNTTSSKSKLSRLRGLVASVSSCRPTHYTEIPEEEFTTRTGEETTKFQLPYWVVYIGWFLAIGGIFACAFMILLYSMEWGKQKSEEWLSTFLLSMIQSAIVVDPILIVTMAFCIALVFKTLTNNINSKNYSGLSNMDVQASGEVGPVYAEPPLRQVDLDEAKRKRSTEVRQRITVIEIVSNLFWLWILLSVSYSNRDNRTYRLHETILNTMNRNPSEPFHKINSTASFYSWLEQTAIPAILPVEDFKGDSLHWSDQQYIGDLTNFRIGPPRLRQLRVHSEPCNLPLIETEHCYRDYSYWSSETGEFCLSWRDPPCRLEESVYNYSSQSWKYHPADPFSGIPLFGHVSSYENGGYKADLDISRNISELIIEELFDSMWIDRKTRAIILEFTVYCANVNLFAFSMFMIEHPDTGGAIASFSIFPIRIYHHLGPVGSYILFCEVMALFYFIWVFIRIGMQIFEHKCEFYKQFWILFDIGTAVIAVNVVAFYAIRLYTATTAISLFRQDKRAFVDFYQVAFYDQIFVTFLGVMVFMSTIRCLRILEGNKHVYIVANIFYKLANDLLWLGILLIFVFVAFSILGWLLFGSKIMSYMSIYKSLTTLFLTVIGKSKFGEINESDPILAKIYFTFFVFVVSLLMMSVFLSSLSACIEQVSEGKTNIDDVFLIAIEKLLNVLKGKPPASAKPPNDYDAYSMYSLGNTSFSYDVTLEDYDDDDDRTVTSYVDSKVGTPSVSGSISTPDTNNQMSVHTSTV